MFLRHQAFQIGAGSTQDLIERIRSDVIPLLSTQPGFFAYYVIELPNNVLATVRVFEDEDSLKAAHVATADVLTAIVEEFEVPDTVLDFDPSYDGEVSTGVAYARLFL
jgi:hypothetical protein